MAQIADDHPAAGGPVTFLARSPARLQKKGTRSARRLLKLRRRREQGFARNVNHALGKRLVAEAQGTGRGIALEALGGIRERVSVSRSQRATLHSWAFDQLHQFVAYSKLLATKLLLWPAVHYELVEQADDWDGVHGWAVRAARGRG